jgi:hypothetical protein
MPELPRPGQQVRWRNPQDARGGGWQDVFGPGPFEVVRIVDHSDLGLATGVVVRTALGEQEISEVWLTLVDAPASRSRRRVIGLPGSQNGDQNAKRLEAGRPPTPKKAPA